MPERTPPSSTAARSALAVVSFLVFVELCSGILQGSVPTLVPLIGAQMHISSGSLSWVNTLPLLVSGISVPLASKLGDIHGHRRMILITMAAVAVGSVLAATTTSFGLLLVGRALQGLYTAWLPLDFAIVRDRVQGRQAGTGIGLLVGAVFLGSTLGAVGTGLLSQHVATARAMMWFPAVAILLCLPVVLLLIPESVTRNRSRIDWSGTVLLSTGLGTGLLALGRGSAWGWTSATVLVLAAAAVLALAAFTVTELRAAEPLIDVRLITGRRLAPLYLLSFVIGIAMFGSQTAGSTFMATPKQFGFGFGFDTLRLSLMALPTTVAAFLSAGAASRLLRVLGARTPLALGFAGFTASYALIALAHSAPWQFVVSGVLAGVGLGLVIGALPVQIMGHLPADQTGIGTGIYNTLKALAGSVSGAAFAAVLDHNLLKLPVPGVELSDLHGYVIVWTSCAVICLLGLGLSLVIGRAPVTTGQTSLRPVEALSSE
ncbi:MULTISPECIES: MFS transporter [Streptacidiphilus]|uniref:MFS transporter n=1 Tax=Streptacidiphilus cavernicola TaxID=3342716 RepID=A0ABV6UPK4_9ACTN|nr:MFS transporter [Streptacidiphilus jeojiense]